jgi:HAMP domain-containing protein
MRGRTVLIFFLIGLGLGAIGVGLALAGDVEEYASSSLLEIGATLLLVVPLLFVERALERRVERVRSTTEESVGKVEKDVQVLRDEVGEATSRIGELRSEFLDQVGQRREHDERAVTEAREAISWESIAALLDRAESLGGVSEDGVRVKLPHLWERVRFRQVRTEPPEGGESEPMTWISVETVGGEEVGIRAIWKPGEKAIDPLLRLAEEWQKEGTYPGDSTLDPDQLFGGLVDALETAIRSRTNERGTEALNALIEKVNDRWAITDFGLEHLGQPEYSIKKEDIVSDPAMRREHMLDKTWVTEHADEFREAFMVAEPFFKPRKRRQLPIREKGQ